MEEKHSTKLLLKSSFWYILSSFLTKAMAFITTPIFTRIMPKADYGNFSVFANWQQVLVIICGVEVYSTLNRARFDFTEKRDLDGYITSSLTLSLIVTGVFFLAFMLLPDLFDKAFKIDRRYMYIMFGYLFAYPALSMFQTKQRIEYKYKLNAGLSFFLTIASSLLALVLVKNATTDKLYGRIFGQYTLSIVAGLIFLVYFVSVSRQIRKVYWKYALRIGLPMVFSYLAGRVLLASDTFVIQHMGTAEQISNLSVTHSVSHIITLLVQTVNMAWAPWFYDMLKAERTRALRKAYAIYLWGSIACTLFALLLGPELITLLGGKAYSEALDLLPPYILSGVFTVLTAQLGSLETYYKKPEYAAILTGIAAALNIALDIIGVKLWDYRAVCYATVLCQIILIVMHYFVAGKMSIRETLTPRTLTLSIAASLALIPVSFLMYRSDAIRYALIVVIAAAGVYMAVRYRETIKKLVRRFR